MSEVRCEAQMTAGKGWVRCSHNAKFDRFGHRVCGVHARQFDGWGGSLVTQSELAWKLWGRAWAPPRDCEHGHLARKCQICESEADIAELKAENAALLAERDRKDAEYRDLFGHHRQCELAGTALAELVKREVTGNGAPVDDNVLMKAVAAWDAHQWPAAALSAPEEGESELSRADVVSATFDAHVQRWASTWCGQERMGYAPTCEQVRELRAWVRSLVAPEEGEPG